MAGTWRLLIGQLRRATSRKGASASPPARASADLDGKSAVSFLEPSSASAAAAAAEPAAYAFPVPAIVLRGEQREGETEGEAPPSLLHSCGAAGEMARRHEEQGGGCRCCCCCCEKLHPPAQDIPPNRDSSASTPSPDGCCCALSAAEAVCAASADAPAHPQKLQMSRYASSLRRAIVKLACRPIVDSVGSLIPAYKRQPGPGNGSATTYDSEPQLSRAEVIDLLCKQPPQCNIVLPRSGFVFGLDLEDLPLVVTSEVVFERGLRCRVPLIVERCARYILESGTDVVGVFRVCGSIKRMKELRMLFDTPPAFGRDVQLGYRCSYSVHDCAGVLKRYLMELPQPVIPWELYAAFREVELLAEGNGDSALTKPAAAKSLAEFIRDLPCMNRDLLLFLTGMLAVFSSYSCRTLMCVDNLAAVFQPGLLNHPKHARDPAEYARNQRIVAALVRYNLALFVDQGLERLPPAGQGKSPTRSWEIASLIRPDVPAGVPRHPRQRDRLLPRRSAEPQHRDSPADPSPSLPVEPDSPRENPTADQSLPLAQPCSPSAARTPHSRQPPPPPLLTTLTSTSHRGSPCSTSRTSPRRQRSGCTLQRNHARRNRRGWYACPISTTATVVAPNGMTASSTRVGTPPAPFSYFPPHSPTAARDAAAGLISGGQLGRWPSFLSDRPKRSSTVAPSIPRRSATISVMPRSSSFRSSPFPGSPKNPGKRHAAAAASGQNAAAARRDARRERRAAFTTAASGGTDGTLPALPTEDAVVSRDPDVSAR